MTTIAGTVSPVQRIESVPGVSSRLTGEVRTREPLAAYLATGGYRPLGDRKAVLDEIDRSAVRGRGGAAFPIARKLRGVLDGGGHPVVVANGEEGEPASVKDRWLMRTRPHLVLDGLRSAAHCLDASDLHIYVSDEPSRDSVAAALDEARSAGLWMHAATMTCVEPSYVAGEETAVVRAINGGPALPSDKPPRPFQSGVRSEPTLISNVETLAQVALCLRDGATAYRSLGTATSAGTFLLTLGGTTAAGLYEVPFGTTLRSVLGWLGEDADTVRAILAGGYFAGVVGAHALDTPLDYDAFSAIGSGLGCGAVTVLVDTCPVAASAAVMRYFARYNAGQCGSCFNGTAAMSAVLDALCDGRAEQADIDRLTDWSVRLRGRGACGTLDGATNIAASLLREFPHLVASHLKDACAACSSADFDDPPFAVGLSS